MTADEAKNLKPGDKVRYEMGLLGLPRWSGNVDCGSVGEFRVGPVEYVDDLFVTVRINSSSFPTWSFFARALVELQRVVPKVRLIRKPTHYETEAV